MMTKTCMATTKCAAGAAAIGDLASDGAMDNLRGIWAETAELRGGKSTKIAHCQADARGLG
jgi:hypothetical protein